MSYLLPIAVLTLFLPLKVRTDFVQLRPFDALVIVMLLWTIAHGTRLPRGRFTIGFLVLLPYFFCHVISAFAVDAINGLREGLQIFTVISFAYVLAVYSDKIDIKTVGRVFLYGLVSITAFNIGWHIEHGHLTGWKRLVDPKAAFNFLPMVLGILLVLSRKSERQVYWILWVGLLIILVMSGERKALLIYALTTSFIVARGRVFVFASALATAYLCLALYVQTLDQTSYVATHLNTFLDPGGTSFRSAMRGEVPTSLSDAQRQFTLHLSSQLFAEHPFFGIGTNRFVELVDQHYAYLPEYMKGGIHGEFQRVLTENGLFGFVLYLSIWSLGFWRIRKVMHQALVSRWLTFAQTRGIPFLMVMSPVAYVAAESSGTHSYVPLIVVSLAPEVIFYALSRHLRSVNRVQGASDGLQVNDHEEIGMSGVLERG